MTEIHLARIYILSDIIDEFWLVLKICECILAVSIFKVIKNRW